MNFKRKERNKKELLLK